MPLISTFANASIRGYGFGSALASTNSYESIATVTVGSGGVASIDFTSIPSTFKHLQLRGSVRSSQASAGSSLRMRFNGDSGSNYDYHAIYGNGSSAAAENIAPVNIMLVGNCPAASSGSNIFNANVIDLLDYTNTNKYKTVRFLDGYDTNGGGQVTFGSDLWMNTTAITSISITAATGNFVQYSQFALYGIKG